MVSYACHLQSSSDMLPSAALMPPCAATVWERVGNSFVMHLPRHEYMCQPLLGETYLSTFNEPQTFLTKEFTILSNPKNVPTRIKHHNTSCPVP